MPEARSETITIGVADQAGFAVDDLDRALGTRRRAQAAAGTLIFINPYDISHGHLLSP
jgi:hypothetical protein